MDEWVSSEESHIIEGKYAVGKTYILTEKQSRDGYATAESVEFTVADDGKIQKVSMTDDTIKVQFNKTASDTKKQLSGAKYKVYDSKGKMVYEFTTGKNAELIEGILKAGETYTFKEAQAPEHYKVAKDKNCLLYTSFPKETVKSRFLKLDISHIEYVLECMNHNTTKIKNIKKYLLAALYNAPTTIDSYYKARVQHDMPERCV